MQKRLKNQRSVVLNANLKNCKTDAVIIRILTASVLQFFKFTLRNAKKESQFLDAGCHLKYLQDLCLAPTPHNASYHKRPNKDPGHLFNCRGPSGGCLQAFKRGRRLFSYRN